MQTSWSAKEAAELAEESASVLRRVLALVDSGGLEASGRTGARLIERLRVAADALDRIAAIHREEAQTRRRMAPEERLDVLLAESSKPPTDG